MGRNPIDPPPCGTPLRNIASSVTVRRAPQDFLIRHIEPPVIGGEAGRRTFRVLWESAHTASR